MKIDKFFSNFVSSICPIRSKIIQPFKPMQTKCNQPIQQARQIPSHVLEGHHRWIMTAWCTRHWVHPQPVLKPTSKTMVASWQIVSASLLMTKHWTMLWIRVNWQRVCSQQNRKGKVIPLWTHLATMEQVVTHKGKAIMGKRHPGHGALGITWLVRTLERAPLEKSRQVRTISPRKR